MSTRANIKVVDDTTTLWFYRHSDGDPETTLPVLTQFMRWMADERIRANAQQSSGWLIALGMQEHGTGTEPNGDWKIGTIEPTDGQHSDISYLYTVDTVKQEIRVEATASKRGRFSLNVIKVSKSLS
jgi:hypothetical protein